MHTRPSEPVRRVERAKPKLRVRPMPVRASTGRSDDGEAFLHDPQGGPAHTREQLAETLAEEFVAAATSAQEVSEDVRDAVVPEEIGGPFLQATAEEEFADDVDGANPPDAERAPFPTAIRLER